MSIAHPVEGMIQRNGQPAATRLCLAWETVQ
jgi:hypothetical protein